jgi:hypothetical protein
MFDFSIFESGLPVLKFREKFWSTKEGLDSNPDPETHSAVYRYRNGANKLVDEIGPLSALAVYLLESYRIPPEAVVRWISGNGAFDGEIRVDGCSLHVEICKPILGQQRMFDGERVIENGFAPVENLNSSDWDGGLPAVVMNAIKGKAQRTYTTKKDDISVLAICVSVNQINLHRLLAEQVFSDKTLEAFIVDLSISADKVVLMAYNWDASESKIVCVKQ